MDGMLSDDDFSTDDSVFSHDSIGSSYASEDDFLFDELDEDESVGDWKVIDPTEKNIILHFDMIDKRFLFSLKKATSVLQTKVEKAKSSFLDADIERMTPETLNFNCFASVELWHFLLGFINRNLHPNEEKATISDVTALLCLIFALSSYRVSLHEALENLPDFPLINDCANQVSGGQQRCKALLHALDKKTPKEHYGPSWDYLFSADKDVKELERIVSWSCSNIGFTEGDTELLVDDDKLRNRSSRAIDFGFTWSKGLKLFGPVANMIGAVFTGLFLASCISVVGQTNFQATKIMLMLITNATIESQLKMRGCTLSGDRAYNDESFFEFSSSIELMTHNTYKRCGSSPFKFGVTRYKTSLDQIEVSENGPKTVLWAQKKPLVKGGPPMNLVLYQNGTGRCVMIASTKPGMDGRNWNAIPQDTEEFDLFNSAHWYDIEKPNADSSDGKPDDDLDDKSDNDSGDESRTSESEDDLGNDDSNDESDNDSSGDESRTSESKEEQYRGWWLDMIGPVIGVLSLFPFFVLRTVFLAKCTILTLAQAEPAWFLMRMFCYTSTTAYKHIKSIPSSKLNDIQRELLEDVLGIELMPDANSDDDDEPDECSMSIAELMSMSKK